MCVYLHTLYNSKVAVPVRGENPQPPLELSLGAKGHAVFSHPGPKALLIVDPAGRKPAFCAGAVLCLEKLGGDFRS